MFLKEKVVLPSISKSDHHSIDRILNSFEGYMARMDKNIDRIDKNMDMLVSVVRDGFSFLNACQTKTVKRLNKISIVVDGISNQIHNKADKSAHNKESRD
jgi:hypothetical protein